MKTFILSAMALIGLSSPAFADAYFCSTMPKNNPKAFKVMVYTYPNGYIFFQDGSGPNVSAVNDFHCFPPMRDGSRYFARSAGGRRWGYELWSNYPESNTIGMNLYLEGPQCRIIHLQCDHSVNPQQSTPQPIETPTPDPTYWPYSPTPNSAGYPS